MEIKRVKVGYLETNCYIISDSKDCLIIDPGDNYELIKKNIDNNVLAILITHSHFDHIGALEQMKNKYKVPVYSFNNIEEKEYKINNFKFKVIKNPGHSKDSISFYFYENNFMMVGDFIFKNSIGRTDLEGGNIEEMLSSLNKLKTYPKSIKLYPGHGSETTIEEELINNYYMKIL